MLEMEETKGNDGKRGKESGFRISLLNLLVLVCQGILTFWPSGAHGYACVRVFKWGKCVSVLF